LLERGKGQRREFSLRSQAELERLERPCWRESV
jgi:hypothetical protein